jgi:hypothetical protein
MPSSGTLRCVALVRANVPKELGTSIIRVTRIGELGMLAIHQLLVMSKVVPSSLILVNLIMEALSSSETLVLTRAT